jgi:hypothetical protein
MAQTEVRGVGDNTNEIDGSIDGVEAKRSKIRFARANARDTTDAFADRSTTESKPRRQRGIPREKQTQVSIGDNRAEFSSTVKGKAPTLPSEEKEESTVRRKPGPKPKSHLYPSLEDSANQAKFLLSAIEIACVTARGPQGEMTEWERGIISAPLQRCIARIPISVVAKGGLVVDIGFLTIGTSLYFARVFRGVKLPTFGKKPVQETQEDTEAPVPARTEHVVESTRAGDIDGLAQPVPSVISAYMNGNI